MKQVKHKSDKSELKACENVQQYFLSSSLHGLKYIGEATLSVFERTFFGLSFLMVVVLATYFISNIYQKWKDTPVIISLDPVSTDIKDIPFPAVTICNMNQVKRSFALARQTERDRTILDSICTQGDELSSNETSDGKWSYVREFLMNASQPCEDMIQFCRFRTEEFECSQGFMGVLTDEGLCCTFNAVHPKLMFKGFDVSEHVDKAIDEEVEYVTWTPEGGYENSDKPPYPTPVPGPGSNMGLTLIMNADIANYYCSSTSSSGFKVLLHSPIETPRIASFGFSVAAGLETKVVITPKISDASELIRNIPIEKRQCMFANEANLSYYNIYSKKNCEMECSSKITEETCNCTLYYMPRDFLKESTICNRKKAPCYEKVLYDIASSRNEQYSCRNCLPACFEINYDREISTSRLGTGDFITSESIPKRDDDYIQSNIAIIHIYFLDNSYGGYTKSELIGFTEFLSNTGGLLGLFMGFSVISMIEIIYFLFLRPFCKRKRDERAKEDKRLHSLRSQGDDIIGNKSATPVGQKCFKEFVERLEQLNEKTALEKLTGKFKIWSRKVLEKLLVAWNILLDVFKHKSFVENQPPYPYYN